MSSQPKSQYSGIGELEMKILINKKIEESPMVLPAGKAMAYFPGKDGLIPRVNVLRIAMINIFFICFICCIQNVPGNAEDDQSTVYCMLFTRSFGSARGCHIV